MMAASPPMKWFQSSKKPRVELLRAEREIIDVDLNGGQLRLDVRLFYEDEASSQIAIRLVNQTNWGPYS